MPCLTEAGRGFHPVKHRLDRAGVIETYKMRKHSTRPLPIWTSPFGRKTEPIDAKAAKNGFNIVRTNLAADVLDDAATVRSDKSLSRVERAFRAIKTVDLHVRSVHHWLGGRGRTSF
jgi:hypothetical protein